MWGRGPRGNNGACSALCQFLVTSPDTPEKIGPFWCWFLGGWACALSRPLWVFPMNSPVRLEFLLLPPQPPQVFSVSGLGLYFPTLEPLVLRSVTWSTSGCLTSQLQLCPPRSTICHLTGSASRYLSASPLCPGCPSPPLLLVWMSVSSLSPWLSDFHIVWFSVSSGCFFVFKLLLSFFWLCEEAQCVFLHFHLDQTSG